MVEAVNFINAATADPGKLVTTLGDTCYAMGKALKTVNEQSQKQGLSEPERQARREVKAKTLNAVIQTIEAMIKHLEQDPDNHHHILALSSIQHSCKHAMHLDHECHEHHDNIGHAAAQLFAMAHNIRVAAQSDDGPDETYEDHQKDAGSTGSHVSRLGTRHAVMRAPKQNFNPNAPFAVGEVMPKGVPASGVDALSMLSKDEQPATHVMGVKVPDGLLETAAHIIHTKLH